MNRGTKLPRDESLRGSINRKLLGPRGHDNWGKQEELERALKAIDSVQTAAEHFRHEDHVKETDGNQLEKAFTVEFMALRAQFERIKVPPSQETQREEDGNKLPDIQESIPDSDISAETIETIDGTGRHAAEWVSVSPECIVISKEPSDPILYEIPSEFMECLNRMMVSPFGI